MQKKLTEMMEAIKSIVKRLLGLETAQKNTEKRLSTLETALETALDSLNKRISALEKGSKSTAKSNTKSNTKSTAKKTVFYYDITQKGKVNKRNLKSLESSYSYNRERYGKKFIENFKTFKDFKKSLDSLGSIKTRDRVYYTQQEFDKINEVKK